MIHQLPPLPYPVGALEPVMSSETLELHHGKHHKGYVQKLNELIPGTPYEGMSLEQIVMHAEGQIFEQAGQAWNHAFFWQCLKPGGTAPRGPILDALEEDFGGQDVFAQELVEAAVSVFGSGWAWLALDPAGHLRIETTGNADNPIRHGLSPILVVDVWEHAYYVDYRNDRRRFVEAVAGVLAWDFAAGNLEEQRHAGTVAA
jgi:superoxide dismutase, Fe-Mn family